MSRKTRLMAAAVALAEQGVDYTSRHGARCPYCGERARIVCTRPWEGDRRIRYVKCANSRCLLSRLGTPIKAVEVDPRAGTAA